MIKYFNKIAAVVFSILCGWSQALSAQTNKSLDAKAEQWLEANAKFHVVIAVLVLIFLGLVVYLLMMDRKISKLEKQS